MRIIVPAIVLVFAGPGLAPAQVERYEVGRRMKEFEAAWETTTDAARKKRALAIVADATTQFLTFRLGDAARTLDEARFALLSDEPPAAGVRWLHSLAAVPEKRLVDSAAKELRVEVRQFYPVKGGPPDGAKVSLRIGLGKAVEVPLGKLPVKVSVPFEKRDYIAVMNGSDYRLQLTAEHDKQTHLLAECFVSTRHKLDERVREMKPEDRLSHSFQKIDRSTANSGIEIATVCDREEMLLRVVRGEVMESDLHTKSRNADFMNALFAVVFQKRWYTHDLPGDHSITIPTSKDKSTPCRVFVPKGLDPKTPVPVVVALHGMGGSENLYFEGYGAGCVVKACEKRGWLVVSPRAGLGFLGGPPPVADILAKLGERYPIDPKRVFVVGHSMGAAQAVELAQDHPGKFAAVAALGGGGRVRKPAAFENVRVFVGVGGNDFANRGAKALRDALAKSAGEGLTFREYPDVEHMVIVRAAVDDVFAAFDAAAKR